MERVGKEGRGGDVRLREWRRGTVGEEGGWTYHAKGLWIAFNQNSSQAQTGNPEKGKLDGPSISVVGSSNYTKRSYNLDLEAGVVIVTSDEGLKKRLGDERDALEEPWTRNVGKEEFERSERRVGIQVRIAMWIVGVLGGAL